MNEDIGPSGYVGRDCAHDSAALHVTGRAQYVDDLPEPEGMVHVEPGYAPLGTKARLLEVDLTAVRNYPGVLRVLTAQDVPAVNDCSPVAGDDPIFAEDDIFFHGQVVFAVVAETRDAARRAAKLARISVEERKPAISIEDALLQTAPDLMPEYRFCNGDVADEIASAQHQITDQFHVGGQEHFYLEGQIAMAVPEDDGGITIFSSTQHPREVQHCVAKMLGFRDAQVTCICRRMGGGFGGKESQAAQWAALAALAARLTGRAAKCRLDRDLDMMMTGKRHDVRIDYRAGFNAQGKISACDVTFLARCGYSADLSMAVCDRTLFHADNAYHYPAFDLRSRRLRTDTVSNTAFRGFGGPQGMMFAEQLMQHIAVTTGLDGLDVRKANLYTADHCTTPYGQVIKDNIALDLMETLETSCDYRQRRQDITAFNAKNHILKKGLALTPVKFGISFTLQHLNQAGALLHVFTDGSVQINHGGTEMGQGLYTKVAQVVAQEFGIGLDAVQITATRTDKVPNTSPTAASSGSDLNGWAARLAAQTVKQRMVDHLAAQWGCSTASLKFEAGFITASAHRISFAEAAAELHLARISLSATGYYATPDIHWDREAATGSPFFYFAYGASCSEVLIDTLTGEMKVARIDVLHDVGRSLNPAIDIGQIEGGFVQGMGWLTTEELVFDAKGRLSTHAPSTYKIPCASDVPADFRVTLYDSPGNPAETIYRSKAVGEPPLMLPISVWCAVYDAVAATRPGHAPKLQAPATPEAILNALRAPAT